MQHPPLQSSFLSGKWYRSLGVPISVMCVVLAPAHHGWLPHGGLGGRAQVSLAAVFCAAEHVEATAPSSLADEGSTVGWEPRTEKITTRE